MNERKAWIDKLNANMLDAFFDAFNDEDNHDSVIGSVKFPDGSYLEVELYRNNNLEVYYYHANRKNERGCPNITSIIEDSLYSWDKLQERYDTAMYEDEWAANGFRDETDYWNQRL